jgi:hypothetical protein
MACMIALKIPGERGAVYVKVPIAGFPVVEVKVAPGGPCNITHLSTAAGSVLLHVNVKTKVSPTLTQ